MQASSLSQIENFLRQASIHQRSTFFLIIADFGCVRLRCSYRIWLLFLMAIKEKLTPATKSNIFKVKLYAPDCVDFILFISRDITIIKNI